MGRRLTPPLVPPTPPVRDELSDDMRLMRDCQRVLFAEFVDLTPPAVLEERRLRTERKWRRLMWLMSAMVVAIWVLAIAADKPSLTLFAVVPTFAAGLINIEKRITWKAPET